MRIFLFFFITISFISCKNGENYVTEESLNTDVIELSDVSKTDNNEGEQPQIKKIIESDIRILSKNLEQAKLQINKIILQAKAEVSEENLSSTSIELKLYVPRKSYDSLISEFNDKNFDEIESKSTRIINITQKYYELKNQLNSDTILLTKYQELLKKASNVEEVLAIYQKIEDLELEQRNHNDKLAYYNKMQDYNLVTLYVYKPYNTEYSNQNFGTKIKNALVFGLDIIEGLFFGLLSIWPILIIVILTIFGFKKYRSKKNKS